VTSPERDIETEPGYMSAISKLLYSGWPVFRNTAKLHALAAPLQKK